DVASVFVQLLNITSDVIIFKLIKQGAPNNAVYRVVLSTGSNTTAVITTSSTTLNFTGLFPSVEYQISVQQTFCPQKPNYSVAVRTAAKIFAAQIRVTNEVYKSDYSNKSSAAFQDFEKNFIAEVRKS
ncbi:hypothetical protein GDO81_025510, partial [Engystomops pustulosus]